ncbi:PQQ-dependent sugar dehydrogenase [Candidatus Poriferisodalis sp.]|uniref:PQQ-dependent sugar dehydrogenase n=1 Tax=Candidatus Poriferisodalis sp. TaxID=3101277 RepID=UPI003B02396D
MSGARNRDVPADRRCDGAPRMADSSVALDGVGTLSCETSLAALREPSERSVGGLGGARLGRRSGTRAAAFAVVVLLCAGLFPAVSEARVSIDIQASSSAAFQPRADATSATGVDISVTVFVGDLAIPWDLAFTSDGTMLFTQRRGVLQARSPDGTIHTVAADMSDLFASGETGLMAIVVDPAFDTNRRFYTCQGHTGPEVQVIAWTLSNDLATATRANDPLVGGIPTGTRGRHGGCRLRFGPSGNLWIATGDAARGTHAQNLSSLGGKVLRVDPMSGAAASGNPTVGSRVYTYGHRNVQGLALRPGTTQMWSVEHGPSADDEVNLLVAGSNYGWDPVPGYNENVPMTDLGKYPSAIPAKWSSGASTIAASGGIFLDGDDWGAWQGRLAVAALRTSKLVLLEFDADGSLVSEMTPTELNGTYGRLRTPMLGPDGALYVTTSNGSDDKILRVAPSGRSPAFSQPSYAFSLEEHSDPECASFTVEATGPDGDPLAYALSGADAASFRLDDSAPGSVVLNSSLNAAVKPEYQFTVTATNPDGLADTADVTVTVSAGGPANGPPTVTGPPVVTVDENSAGSIASFAGVDPEGGLVALSLTGDDAEAFLLDPQGGLSFASLADFERPVDVDNLNDYEVTVRGCDGVRFGELAVTVTVRNVDEPAGLELSATPLRVGTAANAQLSEPDVPVSSLQWSWWRSNGTPDLSDWARIEGADAASYVLTAADAGRRIGVRIEYEDAFGPQSAEATTDATVQAQPTPPRGGGGGGSGSGGGGGGSGGGGGGGSGGGDGDVDRVTLFVANGWSAADIGSAAALAARTQGSALVYTEAEELSDAVEGLLGIRVVNRIVMIGGERVISPEVSASLGEAEPSAMRQRVSGATRIETAVEAARTVLEGEQPGAATLVVANGWSPADVGVASVVAARLPLAAVVYIAPGEVPEEVHQLIAEVDPADLIVIGGAAAVSAEAGAALRGAAPGAGFRRFSGETRTHTAQIAAQFLERRGPTLLPGERVVIVTSGWSPHDIGLAAMLSARTPGSVVVYTERGSLGTRAAQSINRIGPDLVRIVGDPDTVSAEVRAETDALLAPGARTQRIVGSTRIHTSVNIARTILPRD